LLGSHAGFVVTVSADAFGEKAQAHQRFRPITKQELLDAIHEYGEDSARAQRRYGMMGRWDTGLITDMSSLFRVWGKHPYSPFNEPIGSWNTSSVVTMKEMFGAVSGFNQPIGSWNVGRVSDMALMFRGCTSFNQPLGGWNTSKVISMYGMFERASSFNQPMGNWDTANVFDMAYMFMRASSFNQDISTWNTSRVTDMSGMFEHAECFNQALGIWDTSEVTDMRSMFAGAVSFMQPIGAWNTSKVSNRRGMFYGIADLKIGRIKASHREDDRPLRLALAVAAITVTMPACITAAECCRRGGRWQRRKLLRSKLCDSVPPSHREAAEEDELEPLVRGSASEADFQEEVELLSTRDGVMHLN